jgi:hypothetical protein
MWLLVVIGFTLSSSGGEISTGITFARAPTV